MYCFKLLIFILFSTLIIVHNVRQSVRLTGYFRRFVPNYATHARLLTELLRKNVNWQWNDAQIASFEDLKKELYMRPTLAIYCPNLNTEIHTDVSAIGSDRILL